MAKDLYGKTAEDIKKESEGGGSKKILALFILAIAIIGIIGFAFYSGYLGTLFGEKISNANQAANTLSGLGNDVSGITEDLKDIENKL